MINSRDALIGIIGHAAADDVLTHFQKAGWSIVRVLNPNQCGTCQHWSWEHKGPQHPCEKCDCDQLKDPDPDRTDENFPEPD